MFDAPGGGSGLLEDIQLNDSGSRGEDFDELCWRLTAEAAEASDDGYETLPGLEGLAPGPVLGLVLAAVDRTRRNGYDLVTLLKAHQRMVSHYQAELAADMVEIAYAAPGDAATPPGRRYEAFEFASDEVRAALTLTRRAAESQMCLAFDLVERLPRLWRMLSEGAVDFARARVIIDGTANLYLLDIPVTTAKAIGRRINAHMISLKRDGDTRRHDQIRADITCDLLLGSGPTNHGRGLIDIRVDLTTLAGLDDHAAEIPGLGPVIADIARQVADQQHRAEWRAVITNKDGQIVDIVTTRRRPTTHLARHIQARHPTCSFPGCRIPAKDCDLDHYLPWHQGGPTSLTNNGPKCRHDHILKDHGWTHTHHNGQDHWTSPLGHTYITQGQSP